MAVHAHKKGDESNDRLLQRWKKQVQETGILKTLRERSVFCKKPTRRLVRRRALKREEYRGKNRKKQFYSNM
jgi:ribosomal protein S21